MERCGCANISYTVQDSGQLIGNSMWIVDY